MRNVRKILLYDGDCMFCNSTAMFLSDLDKRKQLEFEPLQSEVGIDILKSANINPAYCDSVVYKRGSRVYVKSDAVLQAIRDVGGLIKYFSYLRFFPRFIRDYIYDFIAVRRKSIACHMPNSH
jgi:predicted DCC family thiol-disulfide oxidoreductase YuxK